MHVGLIHHRDLPGRDPPKRAPVPRGAATLPPELAALRRMPAGPIATFLRMLAFVLMGYALAGRAFAYVGVPPIFIGEITLALGLYTLLRAGSLRGALYTVPSFLLLVFMFWGAVRTVPFLRAYGVEALRDGMMWGYGLYALVVAGVLIAAPWGLLHLERLYRGFLPVFLVLSPILFLLGKVPGLMPWIPFLNGPLIQTKGGDLCVHLAGVFAYLTAVSCPVSTWLAVPFIGISFLLNTTGRGASVAFLAAAGLATCLQAKHRVAPQTVGLLLLALVMLFLSDLRIHISGPDGTGLREISFSQLQDSAQSLMGDSRDDDLEGTRRWRLAWWNDIIDYTFHGQYFWGGKGFGINLADADGYQIDGNLRSPHNGHLTILARSGVMGLGLWCAVQLSWAFCMLDGFYRARRARDYRWSGLFVFLLAVWVAALLNAAFDVYLEGPMGAIWFWTIYGIGLAAIWIHRYAPDVWRLGPLPPSPRRPWWRLRPRQDRGDPAPSHHVAG